MKYESINEFATRVGKTRRTIFRFYNKHVDLQAETKKRGGKRLIPINHKKYWNCELIFDEHKKLVKDYRLTKNLLDYLHENDKPLANKFWGMEWTYFIGINYKYVRNKDYCVSMMNCLYERLNKKYGAKTTIRMFFTTEPNDDRIDGAHNHVVLYVKNEKMKQLVMNAIIKYFKNDRVFYDDYNKYKGGFHYIMKYGIQDEDWGFDGNNLEKEGVKYENKGFQKAI
jgi:hypothetical protein